MKPYRIYFCAILVLILPGPQVVYASYVVGDIVDAGMYREDGYRLGGIGNLDSPFTVLAGPDDTQNYSGIFLLNIEEEGIYVNYLDAPDQVGSVWAAGWADGTTLRIDDVDALNIFNASNFSVSTNMIGWEDSLLAIDGNSISINWGGLYHEVWSDPENPPALCEFQPGHPWCLGIQQLSENTYFYLDFNQAIVVPLPAALPLFLSSLLLSLPFLRLRRITINA
jgi:hypothetical protein